MNEIAQTSDPYKNPYLTQRSRILLSPGYFGEFILDQSFDDGWNEYTKKSFELFLQQILEEREDIGKIDILAFSTQNLIHIILHSSGGLDKDVDDFSKLRQKLEQQFGFSPVELKGTDQSVNQQDEKNYRKTFQQAQASILQASYHKETKKQIIEALEKKKKAKSITQTEKVMLQTLKTQDKELEKWLKTQTNALEDLRESLYVQMAVESTKTDFTNVVNGAVTDVLVELGTTNKKILATKAKSNPENIDQNTEYFSLTSSGSNTQKIDGSDLYLLLGATSGDGEQRIEYDEGYEGFSLPNMRKIEKIYGNSKRGYSFELGTFFAFDGKQSYMYVENNNAYLQVNIPKNEQIHMFLTFDFEKKYGIVKKIDGKNAIVFQEKGEYKLLEHKIFENITDIKDLYLGNEELCGGVIVDIGGREEVFTYENVSYGVREHIIESINELDAMDNREKYEKPTMEGKQIKKVEINDRSPQESFENLYFDDNFELKHIISRGNGKKRMFAREQETGEYDCVVQDIYSSHHTDEIINYVGNDSGEYFLEHNGDLIPFRGKVDYVYRNKSGVKYVRTAADDFFKLDQSALTHGREEIFSPVEVSGLVLGNIKRMYNIIFDKHSGEITCGKVTVSYGIKERDLTFVNQNGKFVIKR